MFAWSPTQLSAKTRLFMLCCPPDHELQGVQLVMQTYVIPHYRSEAGEHCTWSFLEKGEKEFFFKLEESNRVQLEASSSSSSICSCLSTLSSPRHQEFKAK